MDEDVGDVLDREARAVGDFYPEAPPVDRLVAGDDELLLEGDEHVSGEDDPQGLLLDDAPAEGSWLGFLDVVVGVICHDVDLALLAPAVGLFSAEPLGTPRGAGGFQPSRHAHASSDSIGSAMQSPSARAEAPGSCSCRWVALHDYSG
ncbi:uncharacterized protein A4U43_C06F8260 [Asparagus officinalis]|uniref:Uncharacterized protein n=1 Tax=Asparagus officinalis TaxID=4686 RepID=A0A5P1EKD1_ASPOF|nr:uncharacterized protein A4U43_C06F8260 [Asparagus officinalis]